MWPMNPCSSHSDPYGRKCRLTLGPGPPASHTRSVPLCATPTCIFPDSDFQKPGQHLHGFPVWMGIDRSRLGEIASISTMRDALLRRSEAAKLQWGALTFRSWLRTWTGPESDFRRFRSPSVGATP